jgi:hypothetical protein
MSMLSNGNTHQYLSYGCVTPPRRTASSGLAGGMLKSQSVIVQKYENKLPFRQLRGCEYGY